MEENKEIFNKYINLVLELLKYGVHDNVYKFKNNYGITKNGSVVFIDFNELSTDKDSTLKLVESKHWSKEAQFRKFPEGELKNFIHESFNNKLTTDAVKDLWLNK